MIGSFGDIPALLTKGVVLELYSTQRHVSCLPAEMVLLYYPQYFGIAETNRSMFFDVKHVRGDSDKTPNIVKLPARDTRMRISSHRASIK